MDVLVHARMISNVTGSDGISAYNPTFAEVTLADNPLSGPYAYATAQFNHLALTSVSQPSQLKVMIEVCPPLLASLPR